MQNPLAIRVNGIPFENPFLLASGPPGANGRVIAKSFDLGWGGVVTKTITLDASQIVNVSPRYARLTVEGQVVGFENIELISDRPVEQWLPELRNLKASYPSRVLVGSIAEGFDRAAWQELVEKVQATGVDVLELNLSCPHGLPERRMGSALGENPELVRQVVAWVREKARVPVWAKLTPNVGDITLPARAALEAGADGVSAVNTFLSVMGVDLETLRPLPTVAGFSLPGGYSGPAIRPLALRMVMQIAQACPGSAISGVGGIETGGHAAQFMLLGASTVQLCTAAMMRGYELIGELKEDLLRVVRRHELGSVGELVGRSLPYFTSHRDLVERKAAEAAGKAVRPGLDSETWQGAITRDASKLTAE